MPAVVMLPALRLRAVATVRFARRIATPLHTSKSIALMRQCSYESDTRKSSVIGPATYPDSPPTKLRRHPSPARTGGVKANTNTEEMAMSEEREVAVRKEMPVMYKEGVTCGGMAYEAGVPETSMEGARVPSTTAVPSTAAEAPTVTTAAPSTMHRHSGRAYA